MKVIRSEHGYFVRLMRGEKIAESLTAFARDQDLRGGVIQGIGAIEHAQVGFYNWDRRGYDRFEVDPVTELLSLSGNLSLKDGTPFLHAHVVLLKSDTTVLGGHLFEATIAVTGEFSITQIDLRLRRDPDEEVRLHLIEEDA